MTLYLVGDVRASQIAKCIRIHARLCFQSRPAMLNAKDAPKMNDRWRVVAGMVRQDFGQIVVQELSAPVGELRV
jgi:hypothetical protein